MITKVGLIKFWQKKEDDILNNNRLTRCVIYASVGISKENGRLFKMCLKGVKGINKETLYTHTHTFNFEY